MEKNNTFSQKIYLPCCPDENFQRDCKTGVLPSPSPGWSEDWNTLLKGKGKLLDGVKCLEVGYGEVMGKPGTRLFREPLHSPDPLDIVSVSGGPEAPVRGGRGEWDIFAGRRSAAGPSPVHIEYSNPGGHQKGDVLPSSGGEQCRRLLRAERAGKSHNDTEPFNDFAREGERLSKIQVWNDGDYVYGLQLSFTTSDGKENARPPRTPWILRPDPLTLPSGWIRPEQTTSKTLLFKEGEYLKKVSGRAGGAYRPPQRDRELHAQGSGGPE